jgi:hypothetical protein
MSDFEMSGEANSLEYVRYEEAPSVSECETQDTQNEEFDELAYLREEVKNLNNQLNERRELDRANARMNRELTEFCEYFPECNLDEVPEEVWQKVRKGASLCAEFSLMQRKAELEKRRINNINEQNRRMSAGSLGNSDGEKYYSPSEVKKMTPSQVREHYDDIIESMRHWN